LVLLKRRLSKREVVHVIKIGKSVRYGFLVLKYIPSSLLFSRAAFVVGGKVSKKATERNRIRRRISVVTQGILSRSSQGIDVVVIVSPQAKQEPFSVIENNTKNVFKKIGL